MGRKLGDAVHPGATGRITELICGDTFVAQIIVRHEGSTCLLSPVIAFGVGGGGWGQKRGMVKWLRKLTSSGPSQEEDRQRLHSVH